MSSSKVSGLTPIWLLQSPPGLGPRRALRIIVLSAPDISSNPSSVGTDHEDQDDLDLAAAHAPADFHRERAAGLPLQP